MNVRTMFWATATTAVVTSGLLLSPHDVLADPATNFSNRTAAPVPSSEPRLDFVFEAKVQLGQFSMLSSDRGDQRGVMHLMGGTFEGPSIKGKILPSDRDWPTYYGNGVRLTDVQYVYVTDDGIPLFVKVEGYRYETGKMTGAMLASETVSPPANMLRIVMHIHAPESSRYVWMNYNIFVGVAGKSGKDKTADLRVYRLL